MIAAPFVACVALIAAQAPAVGTPEHADVKLPVWTSAPSGPVRASASPAQRAGPAGGAGDPRVGAAAPADLAAPGHRVHVYASEDLNPDSLGALARPGVTLWLRTRSNALAPAVAERLRRFDEVWVEVRAPLKASQLQTIAGTPKIGLWFRHSADFTPSVATLGIRRVAVEVSGALDETTSDRLGRLDAEAVRWSPGSVDLESFGRFAQLSAQKVLVLPAGASLPGCSAAASSISAVEISAAPSGVSAAVRCGFGVRVAVEPDVDDDTLAKLLRQAPAAELEVHADADDRRAMRTRRLIEKLEAASSSVVPGSRRP